MDSAPLPQTNSQTHVVVVLFVLTFAILLFRGYGERYATQPTVQQAAAPQASVDLNRVDRTELLQIPGVGPNMADAILTYRHERGTFASVEDLEAVHGIGGKTLETGAYGFGFSADGKLHVFDLSGKEIISVETTTDKEMKRPRPLMMSVAADGIRFYKGKSYSLITVK